MTVTLKSAVPMFFLMLAMCPFLESGHYYRCGRWCYCNKRYKIARCTDHGVNLTYIPKIPDYVANIVFAANYLPSISTSSFRNITASRINNLTLASNNITLVTPGAFAPFINLKSLKLNGNRFEYSTFRIIFDDIQTLPLTMLSLEDMNIEDTGIMSILHSQTLARLILNGNRIKTFNQSDFRHIPNLSHLHLKYNHVTNVILSHSLTLEVLVLAFNRIDMFPNFCTPNGTYFPNLVAINFDHNRLYNIYNSHLRCLKSLKLLSLGANPIHEIPTNTFSGLQSLESLFLETIQTRCVIRDYAFNNSNLRYISLHYCGIEFKEEVGKNAFKGLPRLDSLDVSYNQFLSCTDQNLQDWFGDLTNLTGFNFGACKATTFPKVIQNFKKLQYLQFYFNEIKDLPDGAFKELTSLSHLWLQSNHLTNIREEVFTNKVRERLQVVSLWGNPFVCDCKLRWFLNWTTYERHKFHKFPKGYVCSSPPSLKNKLLSEVHFGTYTCIVPLAVSMALVWCSGIILLCFVISTLIVKFRWKIRYAYYKWKVRHNHDLRRLAEQEFLYDAYVIYNVQDIKWIKDELIPNMEEEAGMKLYVRDRDSLVGDPKVDNVVNNMMTSRACLVILSNAMARDEECLFELMYAQRQINSVPNFRISLVLLEEVGARNVTGAVYALVKMHSYIPWAEDPDAGHFCWNRLRRELTHEQRED